jgi:cytoskeletal protein RodZ
MTGGMKMSSEMQNTTSKEKGDGRKKVIIAVVAVVVVLLISTISVMAALLVKTNKEKEAAIAAKVEAEPANEPRKVITPDTAEEVIEEIIADSKIDQNIPQSYTVTQNSTWTFANGTATSQDAYVENDKENETAIYFDLIVDETGERVYSSPVLELGAVLENFALDKPLSKGEYECTVEYHLIDDDQNTLTTTNIGVNVVVLE